MTATHSGRPPVDASMSASGDYGEPSFSTVVLPDPPAWLNIDAILPYDNRETLKDVIETGRELLPAVADWARWARSALAALESLPDIVWEDTRVSDCLGITALNDVMFLVGAMGGNPAGTPGDSQLARLREEYPQYAHLLD